MTYNKTYQLKIKIKGFLDPQHIPKIDWVRIKGKNFNELIRPIYKFVKFLTETSSKCVSLWYRMRLKKIAKNEVIESSPIIKLNSQDWGSGL